MNQFFDECDRLVNNDRQDDYGDPVENLIRIAQVVSNVLDRDFTPRDVAMFFICVKMVREGKIHKKDNLLDMACYAEILDRWEGGV